MKFRLLIVALLGLSFSAVAEAHISLQFPKPRHAGNPPLKDGPCGVANEAKPATAMAGNVFRPGQTIMVQWTETIEHPGHFRIAFLPTGQDFKEPTSFTDIQMNPTLPVLADNLFPHTSGDSGKTYMAPVTLPNVTCANCTLQIIQMMTDKPPYSLSPPGGNGNDVYHECADITLMDSGGTPDAGARDGGAARDGRTPDRPGTGGAGGGAGGAGGSGGSAGAGGGGTAGTGGAPAPTAGSAGGSAGRGGSAGTGGTAPNAPAPSDDSGGFCSIGGRDQKPVFALLFVAVAAALGWRTRRRRR